MKKLYKCDSKLRIYQPLIMSPGNDRKGNRGFSTFFNIQPKARRPLVDYSAPKYNLTALMKTYMVHYQKMKRVINKVKPVRVVNVDVNEYEEVKNKMIKDHEQFVNEMDFNGIEIRVNDFAHSSQNRDEGKKSIRNKKIADDYDNRLKSKMEMDESEYDYYGFDTNNNTSGLSKEKKKQPSRPQSLKSKGENNRDNNKHDLYNIEEEKGMPNDKNDKRQKIKKKKEKKKKKKSSSSSLSSMSTQKQKNESKTPHENIKNKNKDLIMLKDKLNYNSNEEQEQEHEQHKNNPRELFITPNDKNDFEQIESRVISSAKTRQTNQLAEIDPNPNLNRMLKKEIQIQLIQSSYRKYKLGQNNQSKNKVYIGFDPSKRNLIKIYFNKTIDTPDFKGQVLSLFVQIYVLDKMTTYNEIVTIADLKGLNIISKSKVNKDFIKAQKKNIAKKLFIQYDKKLDSELEKSIKQFTLVNQDKQTKGDQSHGGSSIDERQFARYSNKESDSGYNIEYNNQF